jgi:hypothetical protein
MRNRERWFHLRGTITFETELFVRADTREEAEEVDWGNDNSHSGELLDGRLLEVEECEPPL